MLIGVRMLVNPNSSKDLDAVHALQDAIGVTSKSAGTFVAPTFDQVLQKKVRDALLRAERNGSRLKRHVRLEERCGIQCGA